MNDQSRLEAARSAAGEQGSEWFRSPLALLAGLILFVGILAVIVVSVTGGSDDTDTNDTAAAVGDEAAEEPAADDGAASEPQAGDLVAPPPAFGGDEVAEIGVVGISGEPLPRFESPTSDPAVGTAAPIITTSSLGNGAPITLEPGRARVIGFFAHWCPHCQAELPEVVAWLEANELPANTELIAVSTAVSEDRGNYPPSEWFTREGWPAPVIVDVASGSILGAYGFSGFPAFIAIDANGIVVERAGGNIGAAGLDALFANFAGSPQS